MSLLTCHVTDLLQTSGTEGIPMLQNDRQGVAWGDWNTPSFKFQSQFDCPSIVHIPSSTFHELHSVFGPVRMLQSGWWRVESNCRKVQYVNIFICLNVAVCLGHDVHVSVCGCQVSLLLCLYLQMYTSERIGGLCVQLCNWCWNQHGGKTLQSAARTGFELSTVHYRYVCTF